MGNIPTYTSRVPIPVGRPGVSTFSPRALGQLEQIGAHMMRRQEDDDATGAMNGVLALDAWEDDYHNNPDGGALASGDSQGFGARGAYEQFSNERELKLSEIQDGLDGQGQKNVFRALMQRRPDISGDKMARFEAAETDQARRTTAQQYKSMIVTSAAELALAGNFEDAENTLDEALQIMGQENHADPQAVQELEIQGLKTQFHEKVFQGMLDDDPAKAQAYLKTMRADMDPVVFKGLEVACKKRVNQAEGVALYQTVFSEGAGRQQVHDKIEASDATAAVKALAMQTADDDVADRQADRQADESAARVQAKKETREATRLGKQLIDEGTRFRDMPHDVLDTITPAQRQGLQLLSEARASGLRVPADYALEGDLFTSWIAFINGEDSDFQTRDLTLLYGIHDDERITQWTQRQDALAAPNADEHTKITGRRFEYAQTNSVIGKALSARLNDETTSRQLHGRLINRAVAYIDDWHEGNPGKTMDPGELTQMINVFVEAADIDEAGPNVAAAQDATLVGGTGTGLDEVLGESSPVGVDEKDQVTQ